MWIKRIWWLARWIFYFYTVCFFNKHSCLKLNMLHTLARLGGQWNFVSLGWNLNFVHQTKPHVSCVFSCDINFMDNVPITMRYSVFWSQSDSFYKLYCTLNLDLLFMCSKWYLNSYPDPDTSFDLFGREKEVWQCTYCNFSSLHDFLIRLFITSIFRRLMNKVFV